MHLLVSFQYTHPGSTVSVLANGSCVPCRRHSSASRFRHLSWNPFLQQVCATQVWQWFVLVLTDLIKLFSKLIKLRRERKGWICGQENLLLSQGNPSLVLSTHFGQLIGDPPPTSGFSGHPHTWHIKAHTHVNKCKINILLNAYQTYTIHCFCLFLPSQTLNILNLYLNLLAGMGWGEPPLSFPLSVTPLGTFLLLWLLLVFVNQVLVLIVWFCFRGLSWSPGYNWNGSSLWKLSPIPHVVRI